MVLVSRTGSTQGYIGMLGHRGATAAVAQLVTHLSEVSGFPLRLLLCLYINALCRSINIYKIN